ncbi:hypothetical protein MMC22_009352 [Lobaria immixta]|nr:hypothetical protein [Lobaria immixta]
MFGLKGFRNADLPVEWFNIGTITYGLTIMCTKLAILLLYRRVFLPQRWSAFDVAIRLLMLIICLFYIATTAAKIWECTPRPRIWDKSIEGTCIKAPSLLNASGLFNTISDVLILLVPVRSVWKLNIDTARKVACVLLFTVGLIAPVFSIIGFTARLRLSANPDTSYNQPEIHLWSAAEISTGIICVCLPILPALSRPRRPRPSTSILNGRLNARSPKRFGPEQPTNLNERELFNTEYLELEEHGPSRSDPVTQCAVITAISGGATSLCAVMDGVRTSSPAPEGETCSESAIAVDGGGGIMKSFRIEQSYDEQSKNP